MGEQNSKILRSTLWFSTLSCRALGKCQKPNCTLSKTKQKHAFISRLSTWKPGNSKLLRQWALNCSQTKELLLINAELIWLCWWPIIWWSFLLGSGHLSQGNKEVHRRYDQIWCLGIVWCPLLIYEKICKFL